MRRDGEPEFDVTLVFCTYGRTGEVADFFRALKADTPPGLRLQILVADQNPEDLLSPLLAPYRELWTIRHVRTEIRGISPARNLLLDGLRGGLVAFPDDDCIYLDHTLQKVLEAFRKHPETEVVMGVWSDIAAPDFSGPESDRPVGRFSLFQKGEAFVQFYRADAVRRIGDFDTKFGPGPQAEYPYGGDDSDYLLRAALQGLRIRRVSAVHVAHPLQNTADFRPEKISGYGRTRMALLKKHRMPLWFQLANVLYPLGRMVLHPFSAAYFLAMFRGRFSGWLRG